MRDIIQTYQPTTKGLTMKSLPTLLTTSQLNDLLTGLEGLPTAKVKRYSSSITVTATKRDTGETVKVLSAISGNGKQWHVMAVDGLIHTV